MFEKSDAREVGESYEDARLANFTLTVLDVIFRDSFEE